MDSHQVTLTGRLDYCLPLRYDTLPLIRKNGLVAGYATVHENAKTHLTDDPVNRNLWIWDEGVNK